jgi:hypothetical protein
VARMERDGGVSSSNAIPSTLHGRDVTTGGSARKLSPMEWANPRAHVVPDSSPRTVEGGIVMGGGRGSVAGNQRHGTVTTKVTGKLSQPNWIDVGGAESSGDDGETGSRDGIIKGMEDVISNTREDGT